MDSKQVSDFMTTYIVRKVALLEKVAAASRNIVPVLKDHNLSNTAQELDRLLFELDANEQEMQNAVTADPKSFLEAWLLKMGMPPTL